VGRELDLMETQDQKIKEKISADLTILKDNLTLQENNLYSQQCFTQFKNLIQKLLQMERQILFLHIYFSFSCPICDEI
jgi:hypothetical protein